MNIAATPKVAWSMLAMLAFAVNAPGTGAAAAAEESSRPDARPAREALAAVFPGHAVDRGRCLGALRA